MKKITLLTTALIICQYVNAQVHFTFDSSSDNMGETVLTAESPNSQTFNLKESGNENNTGSATMTSGVVSDPERGMVLQIANRYEFAESPSLPTTGDWTMSYWFKLDSNTGYQPYNLVFYSPTTNALVSIVNVSWNAGKSALYLNKIPGITADQGPALVDGEWNHFVAAFDESENEITTYRNGVFLETQNFGNTYPFAFQSYNRWILGADWGASTLSKYDDFMIHSTLLNQTAVTALYNNQTLSNNNIESFENQIKLYPNPTETTFKIETPKNTSFSNVSLYNILGKAKTIAPTLNKNEYDISNLSSGVYLIKISDIQGNTFTKRIIKK